MKAISAELRKYECRGIKDKTLIGILERARAELNRKSRVPAIELSPGEIALFYHYCNLARGLGEKIRAGEFETLVREVRNIYHLTRHFFERKGIDCGSRDRATDGMVKNMLSEIGYGHSFSS